jgi:putative acetyltransferase
MVASDHRRQGIGAALLVAAARWAREAQIDKLELHVFPHNLAAIALYHKAGYEQEGVRRRHFRRAGGELVDAVLMARHLA